MVCKRKYIIYFGIGAWITGLILLMFLRNFCDIEITDEAYYIAEANLVLEGGVPYAYDSQVASGFTFLMLPFIKIYKFMVPSLEGIFLYMRICFLLFHIAVLVISYGLLYRIFDKKYLILVLSMLIPFWGASIPNFSYNTISIWLIFLIGVINVSALLLQDYRRIKISAAISGILMAFAQFAHSMEVLNVFYIGILILCFNKKERKWRPFLYYIVSGILTFLFVMFCIVAQCGFKRLFFGLDTIFSYKVFREVAPISLALKSLLISCKYEFVIIFFVIICTIFIGCVNSKRRGKIQLKKKYVEKGLLVGILCSLIYILIKKEELEILLSIGAVSGIALLFWLFFIVVLKEMENNIIFLFLMIPSLFLFILNGFFTACTVFDRVYEFVPALFGVMLILGKEYFYKDKIVSYLEIAGIILVSILLIRFDYSYIYRGNSINTLTRKVETGIYKGIYTTEERAEDIIELETYIRKNTEEMDRVLFMEVVPMAYLMSDGNGCTPSTWDIMHYSYGYNNPKAMYRYFENRNQIPDKIIYIYTGRDELLSIETGYYKFNNFVNENYILTQEDSIGKQFRAKIYKLSGNYEEILKSISSLY